MYYTVIKHSSHLRTLGKCRKHYSPTARAFYISLVFSNACRVLSQCKTRLRLLYLLIKLDPWPPWYRCDALPTELWSNTLGARSIYWVYISRKEWNDVKYIRNNSYFRLLISNCLNWKIHSDDHSSLSSTTAVQIWIISYILHVISLLTGDINSINWPRSQCMAS